MGGVRSMMGRVSGKVIFEWKKVGVVDSDSVDDWRDELR